MNSFSDEQMDALVRKYKVTCVAALAQMVGMDGEPTNHQLDASIEAGVRAVALAVASRSAGAVIDAKYDDVLVPFARQMAKELHANSGKGDRPGWLTMTPAIGMLEIYYHAAKLQRAVKNDDADGIREHAADVANMSMMLLDICGGLALLSTTEADAPQETCHA
jgi:hypothetical protein